MSGKTTGNYRVLIVDDDFRVGALHAEMVNALPGFQALEPVQDPRVVPKVVAAQKPDLVLLDLYLPHVSGLELLPALGVDAIMISAATEPENISQAISRGALSFIIKPFGAKTLSSKLKGWARYRRQLEGAGQLDQQGIDRLYKTLQGVDDAAAAGASAAPTEQAVLACVKQSAQPMSVAEVAEAVGVARATAQRYLAALVANEALELQLGYGTRGRPEHRYISR
ncbi:MULTISPECIES: response regulator [Micrococcaceae]|uniref:Transcriptional regulatory protein n=1 Tax=Glutamicibacter soli TaxID=453836 RepID=A0A365YCN6_9MICC|nr:MULTISPECIES: response regulator [Micrococcaceae]ALQ31976.1 two-component system response regulator [Arthrobacter sp. YC-RL1]KLI90278.1 chemotaxis protein CheY [Arthrobacter sp. YC-RL1]RBM00070.1 two-component system response regulator [Glutamicibacter soli]RKS17336.1 two-component system CitB family response regulator [Arthrobacter sp. AG1021]